jgi:hypothetical protein
MAATRDLNLKFEGVDNSPFESPIVWTQKHRTREWELLSCFQMLCFARTNRWGLIEFVGAFNRCQRFVSH